MILKKVWYNMSIFDSLFNNWIQVSDDKNTITIEDYSYETGVIEGTTKNHCVKCVSVNKCWFKNEKGKKPEPFDITGINIVDSILNGLTPGLYHPNCHCKERPILSPNENDVELIIDIGKIQWLYKDKSELIKSLGYKEYEHEIFLSVLKKCIIQSYITGQYKIRKHTKHGAAISLNLDVPGKNEKIGKTYKLVGGYMIFPNGKLKCNTLIGGWQQ